MLTSGNDDPYVRLIESTQVINGRYIHPKCLNAETREGYFSILFRAKDSCIDQDVALKFFHPQHHRDQYRLDSFGREAQLLAELRGQPNILQLIEGEHVFESPLKTSEGIVIPFQMSFFVTELAHGSLKDYIYSDVNNACDSLILFREVCKGVQRLHRLNICHRDLKPGNCLIFPGRDVKLCDFGTARRISDVALAQKYDWPVGDMRYTALELFFGMGNNFQYFFGADFFSMGAILFELFTRQVLTQFVYDFQILNQLGEFFTSVPDRRRVDQVNVLLPNILTRWKLPELHTIENLAPPSIRNRMNNFYKRLADLDYRIRGTLRFEWIFREIQICLKILENEERYQRWQEFKRRRLKNRE